MRRPVLILSAAMLLCALAYGIEVAPGCFTSQYVPVGHPQSLGFSFIVSDTADKFVIVQILPPQQALFGVEGYMPIPDVRWFRIGEGETLRADPDGVFRAQMWTDIPADERFYNKHFLVQALVTGEDLGVWTPVIVVNYFVETEPRKEVSVPPYGDMGVAPSVVEVPAENPVGEFSVFNNTDSAMVYKIVVRTPQRESRRAVNLSPGFAPVPDTSKFVLSPARIKIPPHQSRKVMVRWLSVGALHSDSEAIIMVSDQNGNTDFVRFRVKLGSFSPDRR
ncbi:MAG TPA: hypothetical protein ENG11_02680 [candidate division Zixibacteria bacterium]|nr:hypothetical protein [candidate division Zixibacteria bacterium]